MRWSKAFIPTLKENPSEAEIASHRLMFRGGLLRKLSSGIHDYLPLMMRVLNKLQRLIRQEMDRIGAQEVFLPVLAPADLWKESHRYDAYGPELMRIRDRHEREFVLGPTHEEVITDLVRRDLTSYRQLPLTLYQIQTKFRDEIRPRFGILRAKEFLMKDAYSFHRSLEDLDKTYQDMFKAYGRILDKVGVRWVVVAADGGTIGGDFTQEFMVLAEDGEEAILTCPSCRFAAKQDSFRAQPTKKKKATAPEADTPKKVSTPGARTVEEVTALLRVSPQKLIKTLIYSNKGSRAAAVLVRGDRDALESEIQKTLKWDAIEMAPPARVKEITGAPAGFAGPLGLKNIPVLVDQELDQAFEMVCGANEPDAHYTGVSLPRDLGDTKPIWGPYRRVVSGDPCPQCKEGLRLSRGIEVGHVFKLGTKYSETLKCVYSDEAGIKRPVIMGCYGFGVTRMIGALIEQSHDEKGMIWPKGLAPFDVIVSLISPRDEACRETAEQIYTGLLERGIDVLLDDRDLGAGFKFKDAELIGIPLRVTVGSRGLKEGLVEMTVRSSGEVHKVPPDQVVDDVKKRVRGS